MSTRNIKILSLIGLFAFSDFAFAGAGVITSYSIHYTKLYEQLRDYGQKISFDPDRQNEIEARLARLATLKRKYAPTIEEMLALRERIDAELAELTNLDATRDELAEQVKKAHARNNFV